MIYKKFGFRFDRDWAKGFGCEPPMPPRMRRGDIKFLLLEALKEGPKHGYEIIQGFEGRFSGYRPSPGSVYPTLQMLEEGGFVTSEEVDGKKVYTITEAGLKLLEERGERSFEEAPGMKQNVELWKSLGKLAAAVTEGARNSDEDARKQIADILNQARRDVYAILAEA